jgi:hypothetical protein
VQNDVRTLIMSYNHFIEGGYDFFQYIIVPREAEKGRK